MMDVHKLEDVILGIFVESGIETAGPSVAMPSLQKAWQKTRLSDQDLRTGLTSLMELGVFQTAAQGEAVQLTSIGAEYLRCGALMGFRWKSNCHAFSRWLHHFLSDSTRTPRVAAHLA